MDQSSVGDKEYGSEEQNLTQWRGMRGTVGDTVKMDQRINEAYSGDKAEEHLQGGTQGRCKDRGSGSPAVRSQDSCFASRYWHKFKIVTVSHRSFKFMDSWIVHGKHICLFQPQMHSLTHT